MIFDEEGYYSPSEMFSCITSKKSKMINNKRRFNDEQVKSLESIFENETKLEPKKKVQVAKDLGLQPRQVAIWFQNKRARYKSKQLEKDYTTLKSNYNTLANLFEDLKKEKQSLILQLEKLRGLANYQVDENKFSNTSETTNVESQRGEDEKSESENNQNTSRESYIDQSELGGCSILSDEGSSENTNYIRVVDQSEILTMVQPIDGSLTSSERWDDLRSDGLFDQAVDSCQWWDFWS